jgi:hypothetical protein
MIHHSSLGCINRLEKIKYFIDPNYTYYCKCFLNLLYLFFKKMTTNKQKIMYLWIFNGTIFVRIIITQ